MDWLDEEELTIERRPYRLQHRATVDEWDDLDFLMRFRLTKPTFITVLEMIRPELDHLQPRSRYVTPEQQLLVLLRFLASGNMQLTVADVVRVSQPTVSRILVKVCDAFFPHIHNVIRMPETPDELEKAAAEFFAFANFPRTIGAIDCTHIKIQSPGGPLVCVCVCVCECVQTACLKIDFYLFLQAEGYRNRKNYFSLNVQTISSANLKVLNIVSRWPGATHDQTIFRASRIRERFEAGAFGRFILVGDSGYANTIYLATPFTARNPDLPTNPHMQAYQRAIIRTRNVVERQYGVLKRRFPALAYGLRVETTTAQKLITVAAMLHNICIDCNEAPPPMDDAVERILELENRVVNENGNDRDDPVRRFSAREEIVEMYRNMNDPQ